MTKKHFMAGLVGLLTLAARLTAVEPAAIPDLIHAQAHGIEQSLWVAAEIAVRADGSVDLERFDPYTRQFVADEVEAVRKYHAEPKKPLVLPYNEDQQRCSLVSVMSGHPEFESFLPEVMLAKSKATVAGRIVGSRQGFFRGRPATLFAVQVDSSFGSDAPVPGSVILAPFGEGEIAFEGERFCARTGNFSESPQVGRAVLLFPSEFEDTREAMVLRLSGDRFLFEGNEGRIVMHRLMANPLGSQSWATVLQTAVARLSSKSGAEKP
jgi:hypothetical protein